MRSNLSISDDEGEELVKMARDVVTSYLESGVPPDLPEPFKKKFSFESGVFVTINKNDSLRGCIGYPISSQPLATSLVRAAISAAVNDPRFPSLDRDELDCVTFEVTVLSVPQQITVQNPSDYLEEIKVGRDGLIVENGPYSGLLLPQVPIEFNWTTEQFLEFTCEKAGLERNSWKDPNTKISKFEGVIFYEESPKGSVRRKVLLC